METETEIKEGSENEVIIEGANNTSTANETTQGPELGQEGATADPEIAGAAKEAEKKDDDKAPHSSLYYKSFSNMAHGGFDKLYEMINEFLFLPTDGVDKRGMKKRMPTDYEDMVNMLAQQLEASKVEIKGMIGIILYGNFVITSYGAMIKENLNIRKEHRADAAKQTKSETVQNKTEAVKNPDGSEKKHNDGNGFSHAVVVEKRLITKRGNPAFHHQPCECHVCRVKRGLPPESDVQTAD